MSKSLAAALTSWEGPLPYVLTADLVPQFGLEELSRDHPARVLSVGVAEQGMIGVASGLASFGAPVVCASFAIFLLRGVEVFRNSALLDDRHVILVGGHAGLSAGPNGPTHHVGEDIDVFLALPRVRVLVPADDSDLEQMLHFALSSPGQYYIRISKDLPHRAERGRAVDSMSWTRTLVFGEEVSGLLDCYIVSHGPSWGRAVEAVRGAAEVRPDLQVQVAHIGDLREIELAVPTRARKVIHVVDAYPDSKVALRLKSSIAHEQFVSLGIPLKSDSDDYEVLLAASDIGVDRIRRVILGDD